MLAAFSSIVRNSSTAAFTGAPAITEGMRKAALKRHITPELIKEVQGDLKVLNGPPCELAHFYTIHNTVIEECLRRLDSAANVTKPHKFPLR